MRDAFIMRTVTAQAAFEQMEMVDRERRACKPGIVFDEASDRSSRRVEPGDGNVWQKRTMLGFEADPPETTLDRVMQSFERVGNRDADPKGRRPPLFLEMACAIDDDFECRNADLVKGHRYIFGPMRFDFADEPQSQVQLAIILPARAADAVHQH